GVQLRVRHVRGPRRVAWSPLLVPSGERSGMRFWQNDVCTSILVKAPGALLTRATLPAGNQSRSPGPPATRARQRAGRSRVLPALRAVFAPPAAGRPRPAPPVTPAAARARPAR